MTAGETEERLEKLETSIAHIERLYEQLNEAVIEQGERLRRMQLHLQRIGSTVENIETDRIRATNPKPPHHQ
jgi:uncharacterized coiled-coil protein SlyX